MKSISNKIESEKVKFFMFAKKIQFGEFDLSILYQVIDIQISRNHICHNQWKIIIVQFANHSSFCELDF